MVWFYLIYIENEFTLLVRIPEGRKYQLLPVSLKAVAEQVFVKYEFLKIQC